MVLSSAADVHPNADSRSFGLKRKVTFVLGYAFPVLRPRYETVEQGDEQAAGGGETEAAEEEAEEIRETSSR